MNNPYNGVMIVTAFIANYEVGSIMIDARSPVNIIFKSVFDKLEFINSKLSPNREPLHGFLREQRETKKMITLPVT